jgi:hypothetical protein
MTELSFTVYSSETVMAEIQNFTHTEVQESWGVQFILHSYVGMFLGKKKKWRCYFSAHPQIWLPYGRGKGLFL